MKTKTEMRGEKKKDEEKKQTEERKKWLREELELNRYEKKNTIFEVGNSNH